MKTLRVSLSLLLGGATVWAQDAAPPLSVPANVGVQRTPQELEQLMAPIALYPDALLALILPASTVPTDIVLAARYLRDNPGDRTQIEHRAWDDSVKSLTNYPEVIAWMDENLNWTQQVGEAFARQPAEVMQAVQRLRAKAQAAGTLVDTPQQQVIAEPQVIRIVPTQPDIIYVPHYEPEIVFVDRPIYYGRPFLTFGVGVPVGSWLAFDCDWRRHSIWVGNRHRRWTGHDWRRPVVPFAPSHNFVRSPDVRQWRPPVHVSRTTVNVTRTTRPDIVRPSPFGLATSRTFNHRDSNSNWRRNVDAVPPVVPATPRNFSPGFRGDAIGPQPAPRTVTPRISTPQVTTPQVNTAPPVTADVQPLPQNRRSGGNTPRDNNNSDNNNNRGRGFRDSPPVTTPQVNTAPPVPPNVQPLPQNRRSGGGSPRDNNNDNNSDRGRSFRDSRQNVTPAPQVVPALPRTAPVTSAQPVGPTMPQRSFSRRDSTPQAPQVVPAQPMHNHRSSPPPAVAPVAAPEPAPQQQQQQQSQRGNGGGEARGHRGSYINRDSR